MKSVDIATWFTMFRSLPTWECGLKYLYQLQSPDQNNVTPYVGVWIEIHRFSGTINNRLSLPTWECGLKFAINRRGRGRNIVTPYVGVWIEIPRLYRRTQYRYTSLPTWECGLKYDCIQALCITFCVTPYVGVWIEITVSS